MRPPTHKRNERLAHPAKQGCRHCYGTGFVGYYCSYSKYVIVDGKPKREETKTPLLCACVTKRGKMQLTERKDEQENAEPAPSVDAAPTVPIL